MVAVGTAVAGAAATPAELSFLITRKAGRTKLKLSGSVGLYYMSVLLFLEFTCFVCPNGGTL